MNGIISIITPLLLHMLISELVVPLLLPTADAAMSTLVVSLLVLLPGSWMYYRDMRAGRLGVRPQAGKKDGPFGSRQLCFAVFCFAAGGLLNIVWSSLLNVLGIQQMFSNETQEALLAGRMGLQVISLGLLVPIAEELIFRGLIYNRMKRLLPTGAAICFSALLFAVYHGNPIQIIFAFPMALALAAVFERGGLLVYPVLFHMGANLAAVLVNAV